MAVKHSFRFANAALNNELLVRLRMAKVRHSRASDGSIRYWAGDEERFENDVLGPIRDRIFPSWQLVFCPADWAARYKAYMTRHKVPFEEQWTDDQPCFVIPRQYRPHNWKLPNRQVDKTLLITSRAG